MADTSGSVGVVAPFVLEFNDPLELSGGDVLPGFELIVETYGELNDNASNAVLICHALSGNHHAAGYHQPDDRKPGWWDSMIGPGKPIDTSRLYVVSLNNLGGCDGSTGPRSVNPETGKPYGASFPQVRVSDWVRVQKLAAERLGISRWAAVIGGSLGGMQALQWSVDYPDWVEHCVILAAAPDLTAQNIAFNEIARNAITSDPDWHDGDYLEQSANPDRGLALARMVGHLTYMSAEGLSDRFGRSLLDPENDNPEHALFQVESYLRYQGGQFSSRFDANTYLLMTRALDHFDIAHGFDGDLSLALAGTRAAFLVISFSSDWRFSPARSEEIVDALIANGRSVTYANIDSNAGHDGFLLDIPHYRRLFGAWMSRVAA